MTIKLVKHSDTEVELRLEGRLDTGTAPSAQQAMEQVCGQYRSIILNFADLDYISSAGLRVLLTIQKRMNGNGGRLAVSNVRPAVQEVFEMTGFSSILSLV